MTALPVTQTVPVYNRKAELRARLVIAAIVAALVFGGMLAAQGLEITLKTFATAAAVVVAAWLAGRRSYDLADAER